MNSSPRVAAARGIVARPCIASQNCPDRSATVSSLMLGSGAGKEMVMRLGPSFEGTRWPAGDPRHGVDHGRVVELPGAEEPEEGVDQFGRGVRRHLRARLLVGKRLVAEGPPEDL